MVAAAAAAAVASVPAAQLFFLCCGCGSFLFSAAAQNPWGNHIPTPRYFGEGLTKYLGFHSVLSISL